MDLLRNLLPSTIPLSVFIPDLQSLIDLSTPQPLSGLDAWDLSVIDTSFHDAYHPYSKMLEFGDALVDEFPTMVESFAVGNSYEGVEIEGWRVHLASNESISGIQSGEEGRKRKKVKGKKGKVVGQEVLEFVVQSGQHAREVGPVCRGASTADEVEYSGSDLRRRCTSCTLSWSVRGRNPGARSPSSSELSPSPSSLLSIPTATNLARRTVGCGERTGKMSAAVIAQVRRPPSSLSYVHADETFFAGIDLNSNWGYKWRPGRSTSACSDSYPGKTAFEAFETRAMANYLANGTTWCPDCSDIDEGKREGRRVRAFVDLHSYGQLCERLQ